MSPWTNDFRGNAGNQSKQAITNLMFVLLRSISRYFLLALLVNGCRPSVPTIPGSLPTRISESIGPEATVAGIPPLSPTIQNTSIPSPSIPATNTPIQSETPTAIPAPPVSPSIKGRSGELYESLFSILVGPKSVFQYEVGSDYVQGPGAIDVFNNGDLLILDNAGYRTLLRFDPSGRLVKTLKLYGIQPEIGFIFDVRIFQNEIYILEESYRVKQVRKWSLDGEELAVYKIPDRFPLANGGPISGAITAIDFDCEGNLFLQLYGVEVYAYDEVKRWPAIDPQPSSYRCNKQLFQVQPGNSARQPAIAAGKSCYSTRLTVGLGGLSILKVFPDGSLYPLRVDVMRLWKDGIDQTIHYVSPDGALMGVARIPATDYPLSTSSDFAVGGDGEIYTYLTHPDSIEIVRLNFFNQLDPLVPGAAVPEITPCKPGGG